MPTGLAPQMLVEPAGMMWGCGDHGNEEPTKKHCSVPSFISKLIFLNTEVFSLAIHCSSASWVGCKLSVSVLIQIMVLAAGTRCVAASLREFFYVDDVEMRLDLPMQQKATLWCWSS